jgi:hypothetical protein
MTSPEKKFTLGEVVESFTQVVRDLEPEELLELREWLERTTQRRLPTHGDLALAWVRVVANELRDRADAAIRKLSDAAAGTLPDPVDDLTADDEGDVT